MHLVDAGWSSLVARRAHNPKVVGSNPAPATNEKDSKFNTLIRLVLFRVFLCLNFGGVSKSMLKKSRLNFDKI